VIGSLLDGRYRLEEKLGSGGMSTVYRAFDETLERWVAIKLMHRDLSADADQLERFRREARTAAALSHPHVVTIINAGEDEGHPYIVLEYVEGETLKDRIKRDGPLPPGEAVAYAIEIARALEVAHDARLVHRDIKPQNILIDLEGRAKVTDFGIARSLTESEGLTQAGRVLGTTDYISPEQALGESVSEQSDIYSLGVCLYEMLTGAAPFPGDTHVAVAMKHVREPMPDIRESRPEVSAALAAVVERGTAKDRQNRYASVHELVHDLEEMLAIEAARAGETSGEATSVLRGIEPGRAAVAPPRLRRPRRRLLIPLLAVIALAVAIPLLLTRVESGRTGGANPPGQPELERVRLESDSIGEFDPEPGGDGAESPDAVANVIDDNPSTFWDTETYQCEAYGCDFSATGAPKGGVGLTIDVGEPIAAKRLDLEVPITGWDAEIYAANEVPPDLEGWGQPIGTISNARQEESVRLATGGEEMSNYLIWITSLPPSEGKIAISELTLRR
jgi:tRNA A-37 threonylcarbamoyl transferase component Bud32